MSAVPVLGSAGNPGAQSPESKSQTNLIVNYLPPAMTEEDVKNLFSTVGSIQSCKVVKDKYKQVSLGYAFINYNNPADAERAIQKLNGLPLQSKTLKVSFARPSSSVIKNANLYVAYLPKSYTEVELNEMFRHFGNIITSKILVDLSTQESKGVGFVRFDKHSEAENAIVALNGKQLPGAPQPILVKYANQPKTHSPVSTVNAINTISSMAALSRRVNPVMGAAAGGPIRHSVMPNVRYNPVSMGSGMSSLAGVASPSTYCVFIYNLPENADDSLLYKLFGPFGAITGVKVIRDKEGKCKRFGFVNMMNYEEAMNAISMLNGFQFEGKQLQVSFKKQD